MAIVSLSEAARLVGKSRKTIQRYVADGRLSMSQDVQDKKGIDTSELMRVFGNLSHPAAGTDGVTMSQHIAPSVPDVAALESRIKVLETEVQAKDELLAAKERHLASLEQALRLLQGPERPRRWWNFGR